MSDESSSSKSSEPFFKRLLKVFSPSPTSSDEVADMLRSAENESIIDADALQIMEGALKVSDLQAREIMIPRSQMKFVDVNASLEEILKVVVQSQHSRFPVVGESSDDIQGILLAKELLPLVLSGKDAFDLKNMLRLSGGENRDVVFLFSDAQIKDEAFIEDINNLLNAGEIPNAFPMDEKAQVLEMVRKYC